MLIKTVTQIILGKVLALDSLATKNKTNGLSL